MNLIFGWAQFIFWLGQIPASITAYFLLDTKSLLAYNLALSVLTGIAASKTDLDVARKEE